VPDGLLTVAGPRIGPATGPPRRSGNSGCADGRRPVSGRGRPRSKSKTSTSTCHRIPSEVPTPLRWTGSP